jgi:hypothetical protein
MSYDKMIGFGHIPGTKDQALSQREIDWLQKLGVTPVLHDLKSLLPDAHKEPEPKLLVPNTKSFGSIRQIIQSAPNAFMIPDQLYADSHPLVSLLLDTKRHGIPQCDIVKSGYSLRWRANMDTKSGRFSQRDFNEKSTAVTSQVIGGCIDRDEREHECLDSQSNKEGYTSFLKKYREGQNPSFCDKIPYDQLHVYAGYITARTIYGFAVKHPRHDIMLICEACEDHTQTLSQDMNVTTSYKEFEFEPKQVVGTIPAFAKTPDLFKLFLYGFMRDIQTHIQTNIASAHLNSKSKADFAREHLEHCCPVDESSLRDMGLSNRFQKMTSLRLAGHDLIAEKAALYFGKKLDDVIEGERDTIQQISSRLMKEKRAEKNFITPNESSIGAGFCQNFLSNPHQTPARLHLN